MAHGPNSVGGAFLVNKNVYIKYGGYEEVKRLTAIMPML